MTAWDPSGQLLPLPLALDVALRPAWQGAVIARGGEHLLRSRDLYRDVYAPAYDTVADQVDECVALVANYVEVMLDDRLTAAQRKQVAMLVRQYGKAALFGLNKALGVTDLDDFTQAYRYARAVAARVVRDHRST